MPALCKRLSLRAACLFILVSFLVGCASTRDARDPFEPLNRGIYQFNDALDKAVLKPVAEGYRFIVPQFVRASVSNFFSNINDILVALNNLLQGKFTHFVTDVGRVAINTTLGLGGLFDVASDAGIEKHDEDFGQTLGVWGIGDGPFIMIPLLGPSNARDAVGRYVDYRTDLITYVRPRHVRNILWGVRLVNRRAELLDAGAILEAAALDPYEFIRDAYLQRRRNLIYDGNPPRDKDAVDEKALDEVERVALGSSGASAPVLATRGSVSPAAPAPLAAPLARDVHAAAPAASAGELDAVLQSLPPVMSTRRTARATVDPSPGL